MAEHIFAFVGIHQYRFVGGACKRLEQADAKIYPEKVTYYNLTSMQHAKISYEEAHPKDRDSLKRRAMDQPWYYYVRSQDIQNETELLLWAKSTLGCPYTICLVASTTNVKACSMAAKQGDLEMLQWLHRNGCPWNEETCMCAAEKGHLEILQWARMNGCPWNERTCSLAARNGHLGVLQWAHINGCSWNENTCASAARNGQMEVLQWAQTNGCPWNASTCSCAAEMGTWRFSSGHV